MMICDKCKKPLKETEKFRSCRYMPFGFCLTNPDIAAEYQFCNDCLEEYKKHVLSFFKEE